MGLFDFFSRKPSQSDRYEGKPFLKLVDSFVLDCIGQLDPVTSQSLIEMTPKLREVYGHEGSWQEIVMKQLDFTPQVQISIQEMWFKNQTIAKANGVNLSPIQFAELFVAQNVPSE